jgi:DNA-binding beta-propeller fold protein YncE
MSAKLFFVLLILVFYLDLNATSLDGTSSLVYKSNHYVFRDRNSAQGIVCLDNGFTVLPGTNHASNVFLDLNISVSGAIDLRGTSTMTLLHDLYLDNGVTFSDSGYIYSRGSSLFMGGDLTLPANKVLHCGGDFVIDGGGNTLYIDDSAQLFLDENTTLTLRNVIISTKKSYPGAPAITLSANTSKLALDNVILSLGDDFYINRGQIFIHNDVSVTGTSALVYRSPKSSFITSHGCLLFDLGTTFSYAPSCTSNDLIVMNNQSSTIVLDGCSLNVTHTGMRLTTGRLYLNNKVNLNSMADEYITSPALTLLETITTGTAHRGLSLSPDGKYIAVTDFANDRLKVFSVSSGLQIGGNITTGDSPLFCNWSPDGKYISVANYFGNSVQIFSFSGSALSTVGSAVASPQYPNMCKWSPDGKYIAVTNNGGTYSLRIFKFTGKTPVKTCEDATFTYAQKDCTWSPDGKYIAMVCQNPSDKTLKVYQFTGSTPTQVGSSASVSSVCQSCAWSPDGKYITVITYTGSDNVGIFSFSGDTPTLVGTYASAGNTPFYCAWSPDGRYILTTNNGDNTLSVFSFYGGTPTKIGSDVSTDSGPYYCSWAENGRFVACNNLTEGTVKVFSVNYKADTYAQPMTNSIIWGNSTLGDSYNLDINVLSGARVEITGNVYHDAT